MRSTQRDSRNLHPTQKEALEQLRGALLRTAAKHRSGRRESAEELRCPLKEPASDTSSGEDSSRASFTCATYKPHYSNAFGVLGPRGAGKSTVLNELYEEAQSEKPRGILQKSVGRDPEPIRVQILAPLDCSVLAKDISPGAAVLMHVQKTLEAEKKINALRGASGYQDPVEQVKKLIGCYTRVGRSYHDLCLDISSCPDDYSDYLSKGLRERLDLGAELDQWLDKVLTCLGIDAFVVLLDDFDLIHVDEVHNWIQALLDELHQPRLLFVVTADFYRLDHLSLDTGAHFDDKTGRALLSKLLPPQNRSDLEAWPGEARRDFKPTSDQPDTLWKRVTRAVQGTGVFQELICGLLPEWPRGLVNLYESLESESAEEQGMGAESSPPGANKAVDEVLGRFLPRLATSRGEVLLARRIKELDVGDWVVTLTFEDQALSAEEWQATVEAACTRPRVAAGERLRALGGLEPIPRLKDLKMIIPGERPSASPEQTVPSFPGIDVWARDPTWHDPLRHERLRIRPLRDAADADQSLWTELLIGLGLVDSPRNRLTFLQRWQPAASRLEQCRFHVSFLRRTLRAFFVENAGTLSAEALSWLWPSEDKKKIEIGWAPVARSLRGEPESPIPQLLAELLVDVTRIKQARSPDEVAIEPHEILPREVWALVLLVDGLSRCPWSALSIRSGWQVITFLSLAAAFVRSAYVMALCHDPELEEQKFSDVERWLVGVLRRRDSSPLLWIHEEDLLPRIHALFSDDLSDLLAGRSDALSQAVRAYLQSPLYTSVVELLGRQPEVARRRSTAPSP